MMTARKTYCSRSRYLVAVVGAVLLAVGVAGCASTRTVGEQVDDATLTSKVKTKLAADPEVNPFEIDVDTLDGVVTLRGRVEEVGDRSQAEKLARSTTGVRRVVNEIAIGDLEAGEQVDDAWIATKIKSKLAADPEINPFDIDVDVSAGVVVLSGEVPSAAVRQEAVKLARNTKGVVDVRSEIKVDAG